MRNDSQGNAFDNLAAMLTPAEVSQYLVTHNWELETQHPGISEVWFLPGDSGPKGRVMVPLATDYIDFTRRFRDSIRAVASVYGLHPSLLAEQFAALRSDVLFVRLDQETAHGEIPLGQAESTLKALVKMIRVASGGSGRGRPSASERRLVEQHFRFGHTKPGSFVFSIVSPVAQAGSSDSGSNVLGRRVMSRLAGSVALTSRLAEDWDETARYTAIERGLSSAFLGSIHDLIEPRQVRALAFSFDWAVTVARPPEAVSHVTFDGDLKQTVEHMRADMRQSEQLPADSSPGARDVSADFSPDAHEVTAPGHSDVAPGRGLPRGPVVLVGHVLALDRTTPAGNRSAAGSIELETEVGGERNFVRVPLERADYLLAIDAHRYEFPITVTGILEYRAGALWLTGEVTLVRSLPGTDPMD
ncbi:hypothetical protein ACFVJ5_28885 [Nocardia sp. NPDC127606]|uniref:hypothetical protein n=1 Tax=Nocardia sp. NPDC127606 TaxID=3345406 RepID=UPI0036312756